MASSRHTRASQQPRQPGARTGMTWRQVRRQVEVEALTLALALTPTPALTLTLILTPTLHRCDTQLDVTPPAELKESAL